MLIHRQCLYILYTASFLLTYNFFIDKFLTADGNRGDLSSGNPAVPMSKSFGTCKICTINSSLGDYVVSNGAATAALT